MWSSRLLQRCTGLLEADPCMPYGFFFDPQELGLESAPEYSNAVSVHDVVVAEQKCRADLQVRESL